MTKGQRIRKKREEMGIAQSGLAESIGVSKQTLYKYENDIVTNIPSDKVEALAKELDTTPQYIMGWNEEASTVEVQFMPAPRIDGQVTIIPRGKSIEVETHPGVKYRKKPNHHIMRYTVKEMMMIKRYRNADRDTQHAVDKLLSYVEVKE